MPQTPVRINNATPTMSARCGKNFQPAEATSYPKSELTSGASSATVSRSSELLFCSGVVKKTIAEHDEPPQGERNSERPESLALATLLPGASLAAGPSADLVPIKGDVERGRRVRQGTDADAINASGRDFGDVLEADAPRGFEQSTMPALIP